MCAPSNRAALQAKAQKPGCRPRRLLTDVTTGSRISVEFAAFLEICAGSSAAWLLPWSLCHDDRPCRRRTGGGQGKERPPPRIKPGVTWAGTRPCTRLFAGAPSISMRSSVFEFTQSVFGPKAARLLPEQNKIQLTMQVASKLPLASRQQRFRPSWTPSICAPSCRWREIAHEEPAEWCLPT
jgi:hypothetical protein